MAPFWWASPAVSPIQLQGLQLKPMLPEVVRCLVILPDVMQGFGPKADRDRWSTGFLCPCRCHRSGAPTTLRVLFSHLRRMEHRGRERESETRRAAGRRGRARSWALNRDRFPQASFGSCVRTKPVISPETQESHPSPSLDVHGAFFGEALTNSGVVEDEGKILERRAKGTGTVRKSLPREINAPLFVWALHHLRDLRKLCLHAVLFPGPIAL